MNQFGVQSFLRHSPTNEHLNGPIKRSKYIIMNEKKQQDNFTNETMHEVKK